MMLAHYALTQTALVAADLEAKGFFATLGKVAAVIVALFIGIGLVIGLVIGFFAGRAVGRRTGARDSADV